MATIDRIDVNTIGKSELADVDIFWRGGHISHYQISHKVRAYERKHDFSKMKARISELREQGHTSQEIAELLNFEGFHRAKGGMFNRYNIRELVQHCHLSPIKDQDQRLRPFLKPDEWLLNAFAHELGMPYQTLILWRRKGWLKARRIDERQGRWVVWADQAEKERLQKLYLEQPQNRWRTQHEESALT